MRSSNTHVKGGPSQRCPLPDGARISPTAWYTGTVWVRAGLSPAGLVPRRGRLLYGLTAPLGRLASRAGAPSLDDLLLARHLLIDSLLDRWVASGAVGQVVEIAAGLSGRGARFVDRWPGLQWTEVDLPGMVGYKRAALKRCGLIRNRVRLAGLDALAPGSLESLDLDPSVGVAITTEGLLNYLPHDGVLVLWRAIAGLLGRTALGGWYLPELHPRADIPSSVLERGFRIGLGAFTRGRVTLHHRDRAHAEADLRACGLDPVTWHTGLEAHDHPSAALVQAVACRRMSTGI